MKESVLNEICKYDVCFSRLSLSVFSRNMAWVATAEELQVRVNTSHIYFMVIVTMSPFLAGESRYYAEYTNKHSR